MNYKKIYDLISIYKDEIDRLDLLRQEANNAQDYDEAEYMLGAINSFERTIVDLEKLVDDELGQLEVLVREHQVEGILGVYQHSGV